MKTKKVYCNECKYLIEVGETQEPGFVCEHPNNAKDSKCDGSWLRRGTTSFERKPQVINSKNDCGWFGKR